MTLMVDKARARRAKPPMTVEVKDMLYACVLSELFEFDLISLTHAAAILLSRFVYLVSFISRNVKQAPSRNLLLNSRP